MAVLRSVSSIKLYKDLESKGVEVIGIKSVTYCKDKKAMNIEFKGSESEVLDAMIYLGQNCLVKAEGRDTVWIQYQTPSYIRKVEGLKPVEAMTLPLISVHIGEIADVL